MLQLEKGKEKNGMQSTHGGSCVYYTYINICIITHIKISTKGFSLSFLEISFNPRLTPTQHTDCCRVNEEENTMRTRKDFGVTRKNICEMAVI